MSGTAPERPVIISIFFYHWTAFVLMSDPHPVQFHHSEVGEPEDFINFIVIFFLLHNPPVLPQFATAHRNKITEKNNIILMSYLAEPVLPAEIT